MAVAVHVYNPSTQGGGGGGGAEARGLEVLNHLWIQSEPKAGLGYKILTDKGAKQSSNNSNNKFLH